MSLKELIASIVVTVVVGCAVLGIQFTATSSSYDASIEEKVEKEIQKIMPTAKNVADFECIWNLKGDGYFIYSKDRIVDCRQDGLYLNNKNLFSWTESLHQYYPITKVACLKIFRTTSSGVETKVIMIEFLTQAQALDFLDNQFTPAYNDWVQVLKNTNPVEHKVWLDQINELTAMIE